MADYVMPPYGSTGERIHGWLLEAVQEGQGWLAAQAPSREWAAAAAMLAADSRGPDSSVMSNTEYPKAKRIFRELVASLASFQHEGEFKVLWDNRYYDQAHLLTDIDQNWFRSTKANVHYRKGIQTAVAKGTAYFVEEWDPHFWGPNQGDIRLTAMDPSCVTFVQLPADNNIQNAYMAIVKYEMPINLAKRIYGRINPAFARDLQPDQQSASWIQRGVEKVQQFISPALRVAGRTRQTANGSFPTVNIYHGYIMDDSINLSPAPIQMGAYGTNWTYTVPALGDPIPTGLKNPATGEDLTRPAKADDCRMFPLHRLSVWSSTGVCYDGSSPWWHGGKPITRLSFNDLPWEALGGSAITDIKTMGDGISALMRAMEDSAAARLDPAALYDDSIVSKEWAQAFNPRLAGVRAAAPLSTGGQPIQFPVPPGHYDVPQWIPQFMQDQEGRMDYITGVKDVAAIAKARQIPGADTLEKLLEMAGPIVQDMVRAIEMPLKELGEWRKAYFFQFYNSARIIQVVGPDNYTPEEWNYIPDAMKEKALARFFYLPEQKRQEAVLGQFQFSGGMLTPDIPATASADERSEAIFKLISQFEYEVSESGVNEIHRMTTKLFYLQLMKEGFPISWWTFAKIAKISNFGPPPEGTNTEMERWIAQQHIKINLQGELQKEAALIQAETQAAIQQAMGGGGQPPEDGGAPPAAGGGPPGEVPPVPNLGDGGRAGRPQSYKKPPRMVSKDHGTRSTITTS